MCLFLFCFVFFLFGEKTIRKKQKEKPKIVVLKNNALKFRVFSEFFAPIFAKTNLHCPNFQESSFKFHQKLFYFRTYVDLIQAREW